MPPIVSNKRQLVSEQPESDVRFAVFCRRAGEEPPIWFPASAPAGGPGGTCLSCFPPMLMALWEQRSLGCSGSWSYWISGFPPDLGVTRICRIFDRPEPWDVVHPCPARPLHAFMTPGWLLFPADQAAPGTGDPACPPLSREQQLGAGPVRQYTIYGLLLKH